MSPHHITKMQQRKSVILKGDAEWCLSTSKTLLSDFNNNILLLSAQTDDTFVTIPQKHAQQYLGKEFDAVIFDGLESLQPDSLAVMIGTIKQGGVLIIWLGTDEESYWLQRFNRIAKEFEKAHHSFNIFHNNQYITELLSPEISIENNKVSLTNDQQQAVEAIKKVVYGHRRRPLVLSADRGRGKSASLGIAAAQLLQEGKKTVLVTAPSLAIADIIFSHARSALTKSDYSTGLITVGDAEIRFIAPDKLIDSDYKADLLLVDEAAAIPSPMLEKLLKKYSRIAFSTTLHGYEGTGRGFAVRFQKTLDKFTPGWCSYRMEESVRWGEGDMLEAFSFQSLLLNAEPVDDALISEVQAEGCQISIIDPSALVSDEQSLKELFGLMVLAHYRTRPSDLKMLLDRDDMTLVIARFQGYIVGSVWIVNEGEIDDALSQAIYEGKRRQKGHLLPQSLLSYAGIREAGGLKYQRVVRIVVHPAVQQRDIGQTLLAECVKNARHKNVDVMGASFSMNDDLIEFWAKSAFTFSRLGIQTDAVSASHSVMMLQALSSNGSVVVNESKQRFQKHWQALLLTDFKKLSAEVVVKISQHMSADEKELLQWEQDEIKAFCYGQRAYEFSHITLSRWLSVLIHREVFQQLTINQQHTCVMSILQHRSWTDIAQHLSHTGKAEVVSTLRKAVGDLISN